MAFTNLLQGALIGFLLTFTTYKLLARKKALEKIKIHDRTVKDFHQIIYLLEIQSKRSYS
jgi:hypothetical protein